MTTAITAHAIANAMLECGVCQEVFTDPRILPCGHTFCLKCLQNVPTAKKSIDSDKKIPCPFCRKEFPIENQDLQGLPKNFSVEAMISSLPAMSECVLQGDGNEHGKVEHVCIDCWDVLCASCSAVHRRTKQTKNHTVKPLSDVTMEDIQAHKAIKNTYCMIHKQQEVTLYCTNCEQVCCTTCSATKCKTHNCLDLQDADNGFIGQIKSVLELLLKKHSRYERVVQNMTLAIETLATNSAKTLEDTDKFLNNIEDSLKEALEQVLVQIRRCRETAKQTVSNSSSQETDKLHTSRTHTDTTAHNIMHKVAMIEKYLAQSSTVF